MQRKLHYPGSKQYINFLLVAGLLLASSIIMDEVFLDTV